MYHNVILIGVLVSMLYTELTGLSAGLIVPGYLALCLHSPGRIVYTLALAAAAALLCRLLSEAVILYGRRRFVMLLLLTFLLDLLLGVCGLVDGGLRVIGVLIPGILAREFDRQGFGSTLLSLAVTTGILTLVLLLIGYPVLGR